MLKFFREFLRHPARVGAIAPSGKGLARKMMEPIDFGSAACIVEYGPGTGAFTRELLRRKRPEARLVLIEQNDVFYEAMAAAYSSREDVTVLHGSAEAAVQLLGDLGLAHADYIVSGLPFTSLPQAVSVRVFAATRTLLGETGRLVTFQYSLVKERFFLTYFEKERRLFEWKNLPPAFVFVLKNLPA